MASAPPDEEAGNTIHQNVALPYVCNIPDGMFAGRAISLRGMVKPKGSAEQSRFRIDLCCGLLVHGDHTDNKSLHFNPRFDNGGIFSGKPDRDIVINSLVNNTWGQEERFANVFKEGEQFHIRILCLTQYFKIAVNGKHLCDFLHRMPLELVKTIYIDGNVSVDYVEYQGEVGAPVPDDA
ncbi:hypothetical protein L596_011515 [Steinernema carpocapsae]|nr:hypothetical protein L596_011515 [Steinernema carpocapsae]